MNSYLSHKQINSSRTSGLHVFCILSVGLLDWGRNSGVGPGEEQVIKQNGSDG